MLWGKRRPYGWRVIDKLRRQEQPAAEPLQLDGSDPEHASFARSQLPLPPDRRLKRIRDLPPPIRRNGLYEKTVEVEGWTPLIVCDHAGCYWNLSTVLTSDGRTLTGLSKAGTAPLIARLQAGYFGDEASNAFVDHRRWESIYDNVKTWPNAEVIAREGLRVLALESFMKRDVGSSVMSPLTQHRSDNLGPTTGPKPASWTGTVTRDASLQCFAYVFQFGNREVWKIGHALDINHRLAEVNKHVPHEILGEQWFVCLQHLCANQADAYTMEQQLLSRLRGPTSVGERVACTQVQLDRAWEAVLATFSGPGHRGKHIVDAAPHNDPRN